MFSCNNCYSCPLCNTVLRIAVYKEDDIEKFEYRCEHCSWKSRNVVSGTSLESLQSRLLEKLNNNIYTNKLNDIRERLIEKKKEENNNNKGKNVMDKEVIRYPEFQSSWSMEDLQKKMEEKEKKEIIVDKVLYKYIFYINYYLNRIIFPIYQFHMFQLQIYFQQKSKLI